MLETSGLRLIHFCLPSLLFSHFNPCVMKNLSLFLFFTFGLLLTQCTKENPHQWNKIPPNDNTGNSTPYTIDKGSSMKLDALGRISDEQGNPLKGVQVQLGGKSYTTDSRGLVQINQGDAYSRIAYIQASMDGFFPGSRTFIPQDGINRFEIMLIQKGAAKIFNANTGANLKEGQAEIVLGSGFIDASGNPYTGNVHAFMKHLSPDHPNPDKIMPSELRGANEYGESLLDND